MPPAGKLDISVLVNGARTAMQVWQWGDENVKHGVQLRAEIESETVEQEALSVELDNNPPGHANIAGWPSAKEDQKAIAVALAAASTLRTRPA